MNFTKILGVQFNHMPLSPSGVNIKSLNNSVYRLNSGHP